MAPRDDQTTSELDIFVSDPNIFVLTQTIYTLDLQYTPYFQNTSDRQILQNSKIPRISRVTDEQCRMNIKYLGFPG